MTWGDVPAERACVVRAAVARVLGRQAVLTADDLQAELSREEFPWDRRGFGAVLKQMVTEGFLASLGYTPSRRGHRRPVMRFCRGARRGT